MLNSMCSINSPLGCTKVCEPPKSLLEADLLANHGIHFVDVFETHSTPKAYFGFAHMLGFKVIVDSTCSVDVRPYRKVIVHLMCLNVEVD